jgi:hypothetical protein
MQLAIAEFLLGVDAAARRRGDALVDLPFIAVVPGLEIHAIKQHDCIAGGFVGTSRIDDFRLGPNDAAFVFLDPPRARSGG